MTTNTLSLRMDHPASDTSISTQVVLAITLVLLTLLVTSVNMIVWMVTRLISTRNDMFKYCQAGIVFANLISAAFCLPAQILNISFGYWPFGMPLCIFTITIDSVAFVTVMWLVTMLVMDRVFDSRFKDFYLTFRKTYTRVVHLIIWAILLVLTLPLFLVEFLEHAYKLENGVSRFHCHVPFDATTTLFHLIFGFASPLIIGGMMLTFLWLKIIKNKLIARKDLSGTYVIKSENRTMTPWGNNWLHDFEDRVMMGPNNVLPPLRRHSIGECEQETNEDLPQISGKERRNSLPEATNSSCKISQEKTCHDIPYNSTSDKKSWSTTMLVNTGKQRSQKPSIQQIDTRKLLNGIQSELFARAKQNMPQHEKNRFCEVKNSFKKLLQNRVSPNLCPAGQHSETISVSRAPTQTILVGYQEEDLHLPGTVQTAQPDQQTTEQNRQKIVSTAKKDLHKCPSNISMFSDSVPLQDTHMKDNMWVRGSQVKNQLGISYDNDADFDDDDFIDDEDDDDDDEMQVSKALAVMVGLNVVLWLPFLCVYCRHTFCDSCSINLAVWTMLKSLGQISLITNPVCLLLAHKDWRPLLKFVLSGFGRFSFQCFHRW